MYLYFVRHGQTNDNLNNIVQGRIDNPLNDTGKMQAKETGLKLKNLNIAFDKVYTSPLIRAKQSGEIINSILKVKDIEVIDDLTEREFGNLEGLDVAYMRQLVKQPDFKPIGFEYDDEIIKRVSNCVGKLSKTGENILIVCHSHTIKAMMSYIDNNKYNFDFPLLNAQVVKVKCENGIYEIEEII